MFMPNDIFKHKKWQYGYHILEQMYFWMIILWFHHIHLEYAKSEENQCGVFEMSQWE